MAQDTNISWADRSWSPWFGCTKVSPACDGCYAEHLMDHRFGRVVWGPHGERVPSADWKRPLAWDRAAAKTGERPFVFPSLCDPFDNQAPAELRRAFFDLIRATPNLTWLLLTKRPGNIERLYGEAMLDPPDGGSGYPWPRNAAIGCTVATQEEADRDIPKLLVAKAALNPAFAFVSMEPLLGPVDLVRVVFPHSGASLDVLAGLRNNDPQMPRCGLDWVITGGETDQGAHKARPSHPDWFRSLRDQCAATGVPFHFKQWGEWVSVSEVEGFVGNHMHVFEDGATVRRVGKKAAGRRLDGVIHDARPTLSPLIPANAGTQISGEGRSQEPA